MKNKILKVLVIILFICLASFCVNNLVKVKADSGWDTDYDSGSSWDSNSSWDSGSSWDSDSDSGYSSGTTVSCNTTACKVVTVASSIIITLLIFSPFVVMFVVMMKATRKTNEEANENYQRITNEQILKILPNFNIEEFEKKVYDIFYNVQISWMEFDYDKLKELLSDELYNSYKMDLEMLEAKNQKNIMNDFNLIESKIFKLEEENNSYIAKVIIEVEFIDYVEDTNKHTVLRGSNSKKVHNTYILTFERSKENKSINKCPKCGSELKGNKTSICEYCKTKIVNNNYDWVLTNKEKISQR